jgi:RHS repeat-associated protein
MNGRSWQSERYRFAFNGMEQDASFGERSLDFGARIYSSAVARWLSVDPLIKKFPAYTPYSFVNNMPIWAIDPDGRDIIILSDKTAAGNQGHQAILIGNNVNGWTYISKDGSPGGYTGAYGTPIYVVEKFDTIEEFRNSSHNFKLAGDDHHSNKGGNKKTNVTFALDEGGNKIQRYTEAYYIPTTQIDGTSTDKASLEAAKKSAVSNYCLTNGDCSDVVQDALKVGEDNDGIKLTHGEVPGLWGERPRSKQWWIEFMNKGVDYDQGVKPDNLRLQDGEKGEKVD